MSPTAIGQQLPGVVCRVAEARSSKVKRGRIAAAACRPQAKFSRQLTVLVFNAAHSKQWRHLAGHSRTMAQAAGSSTAGSTVAPLVSAEWLKQHLGECKVLDAAWYLPTQGRDAIAEFQAERIPGARFFDLDRISDPGTSLPHMLPSEAAFAAAADALGISNEDTVVVYDHLGLFSAPRAWWTWRVFGHQNVAVLDGGLHAWKEVGGGLETEPVSQQALEAPAAAARASPPPAAKYQARLRAEDVRDWKAVLANVSSKEEQLVDARPAPRWRGEMPEPRPGLRQGHIPGSHNIPWDAVQAGGKYKSPEELQAIFADAGVDLGKPLVASCGSGTTACILVLAAALAQPGKEVAVYDGSFSEWGALPDVPLGTLIDGELRVE